MHCVILVLIKYCSAAQASREDRNALLTGIRSLVSDTHMTSSPTVKLMNAAIAANADRSGAASATGAKSSTASPASAAAAASGAAGPTGSSRSSRRMSVRETTLADAVSAGTVQSPTIAGENPALISTPKRKPGQQGPPGAQPVAVDPRKPGTTGGPTEDDGSAAELRAQLLAERSNYERMMVQMLSLTNDLNERDEQILELKSREAALKNLLAQKEKMYEQDAMVRLQLGKQLEQVLMDKEEAQEQLEMM